MQTFDWAIRSSSSKSGECYDDQVVVKGLAAACLLTLGCGDLSSSAKADAGGFADARQGTNGDGGVAGKTLCRIDTDVGLDETVDRRDSREVVDGLLRWIRQDNNVDGTFDYIQERIYNTDRALVTINIDLDADTMIDQVQRFVIGLNGKVSTREFHTNNDGAVNASWLYVYDPGERVAEVRYDLDNDGTADRTDYYRWTGDGLL